MEKIEFIKRAKMGDKEALLSLIMEQEKDFYKLAFLYMKNENDAMDALQDMILILYEYIAKLKKNKKDPKSFWLLESLVDIALNSI